MDRPILFVNSVQVEKNNQKQQVYDSRTNKRQDNKIHRIDDVLAFRKLGKKIVVEILSQSGKTSGLVTQISERFIVIDSKKILISEIINLSILSVQ